jgi:hypothetical protein
MRCRICDEPAGWRRRCADCSLLWSVWQASRERGMRELFERFAATGIAPDKVRRFLAAEPKRGGGSILDQIAADASNELLAALGKPARQDGKGVRRLRERGEWRQLDRRPSGESNG